MGSGYGPAGPCRTANRTDEVSAPAASAAIRANSDERVDGTGMSHLTPCVEKRVRLQRPAGLAAGLAQPAGHPVGARHRASAPDPPRVELAQAAQQDGAEDRERDLEQPNHR